MGVPPDSQHGAPAVTRVVETVLPTRHGRFRLVGYRDAAGLGQVAILKGLDVESARPPLVRIHSECLTGDAFGSRRCDCGEQLQAALARIAAEGAGAVIYVRGHEGRGIGLLAKLEAYTLQDAGADTVEANIALGLPADARRYDQSVGILRDLGLDRIRLLSSNPVKQAALEDLGIEVVERLSHIVPARPENAGYLGAKRDRMGHDQPAHDDAWAQLRAGVVAAAPTDHGHGHDRDSDSAAGLVMMYGPLVAAGSPVTIGQLGQSLDGFIASRTGDAEFVTGAQDREHLHRLRALTDAVVVGAGTVCTDDCRLTVRAVEGSNPTRVVLDGRGRVPVDSALFRDGTAPTLWVVWPGTTVPPGLGSHVEVVRLGAGGHIPPWDVLTMLRERGLGRVLVEGGGQVVSAFLAHDALDRIYLTTAPLLIGDGIPGLRFDGEDVLAKARRGLVRRFTLGNDLCTEMILGDNEPR